ncbi:hypothetical protein [Alkalibacillus aidingensis]|nr:hypothetical protein [Alkalibacillus aidingensis]
MESKPIYYDGSGQFNYEIKEALSKESLKVTKAIRKNISANPYNNNPKK